MTSSDIMKPDDTALFDRVVSILEQARTNVVRSVNSSMVVAYWLIGREIVQQVQGGESRAEYGKQVVENLSKSLTAKYGHGFSVTSLQYFRKFYQEFADRLSIPRPPGAESLQKVSHGEISRPPGVEFHPQLSWSHYRVLMRVSDSDARDFYETEAALFSCAGYEQRSRLRKSYSLMNHNSSLLFTKNLQRRLKQAVSARYMGMRPITRLLITVR